MFGVNSGFYCLMHHKSIFPLGHCGIILNFKIILKIYMLLSFFL